MSTVDAMRRQRSDRLTIVRQGLDGNSILLETIISIKCFMDYTLSEGRCNDRTYLIWMSAIYRSADVRSRRRGQASTGRVEEGVQSRL